MLSILSIFSISRTQICTSFAAHTSGLYKNKKRKCLGRVQGVVSHHALFFWGNQLCVVGRTKLNSGGEPRNLEIDSQPRYFLVCPKTKNGYTKSESTGHPSSEMSPSSLSTVEMLVFAPHGVWPRGEKRGCLLRKCRQNGEEAQNRRGRIRSHACSTRSSSCSMRRAGTSVGGYFYLHFFFLHPLFTRIDKVV